MYYKTRRTVEIKGLEVDYGGLRLSGMYYKTRGTVKIKGLRMDNGGVGLSGMYDRNMRHC